METQNKEFKIRTFGFCELAQRYNPHLSKESAANKLRKWVAASQELQDKLKEAAYVKGSKTLTPKQVRLIVEHLGEP